MGDGGKNRPPSWKKDAVATRAGWCHPVTGEVLKCYGQLSVLEGAAEVEAVKFGKKLYAQGETLKVIVQVDEICDVSAGATLLVTSDGPANPITVTASAQSKVSNIVFQGTVPSETATLSIAAQSIVGTIKDQELTNLNPVISAPKAAKAGTRAIA